ncbi:hypothetical protein K440DRAFT_639547 [Wilcoxina mikolae CBS 423.85]|nr:hypothetical protein K440DRAFT_639547 [Wilcoxina mikolae CBS 423.85]
MPPPPPPMPTPSTSSMSASSSGYTGDSSSSSSSTNGDLLVAETTMRCSPEPGNDNTTLVRTPGTRLELFSTPSPEPEPSSNTFIGSQDNNTLRPPPPPPHGSTRILNGTRRVPNLTVRTSRRPVSTILSPPGTPYNFPSTPVRELHIRSMPVLSRVTINSLTVPNDGTPEEKLEMLKREYAVFVGREKEAIGRWAAFVAFGYEAWEEERQKYRAEAKVFKAWREEYKRRIQEAEKEEVMERKKLKRRMGGFWGEVVGDRFKEL